MTSNALFDFTVFAFMCQKGGFYLSIDFLNRKIVVSGGSLPEDGVLIFSQIDINLGFAEVDWENLRKFLECSAGWSPDVSGSTIVLNGQINSGGMVKTKKFVSYVCINDEQKKEILKILRI
jgi:hypothetical protein